MKVRLFAALLLLSQPAFAQLHDTGPMGVEASGSATPDASVLSKMHLPDAPKTMSPTASSPTTGAAVQRSAARMMRFHQVWLDMEASAKRIKDAKDAGKIGAGKAAALQADLDALKAKYKIKYEDEGRSLKQAQREELAAAVKAFGLRLDKELK